MANISIFDCMYEDFKIDKPIRLIELFAGVGSQAMALRNLGANFEHYKVVEFDKYAIASYNAIHETNFETMDITKVKGEDLEIVDTDSFTYLLTYSFPCQDLSVAGKMKGMTKGDNTRSGLLWEVERLLNEVENLPQVLLMENVPQVIGKKNIDNFHLWQHFLEDKGYSNFVDTLNAKNYGVAQNRNRTFMVSILGKWNYNFPKPIPLTKTLKDYLEDEVDEKFYLSEDYNRRFLKSLESNKYPFGNEYKVIGTTKAETERMGTNSRHWVYDTNECMSTLDATMYKQPKQILEPSINQVGMLDMKGNEQTRRVYGDNGISPTLNTMQGGNRQPKVLIPQATKQGYIECNVPGVADLSFPDSKTRRGRVQENGEICPTLMAGQQDICYIAEPQTNSSHTQKDNLVVEQVRALAKTARPNTEIGVTLKPNGDIRPHRMDIKKSGIQELNINHEDNPSYTVTSAHMPKVYGDSTDFRIRKLTPKECWRLMGFTDEDYHKARVALEERFYNGKDRSNSQMYKMAGNSIVVEVLEGIFKQMF